MGYALVTNLLQHPDERSSWRGMRTVGEIKRDANIKNEVNKDNLYTQVTRQEKVFKPLQIPRNLQADLPYSLKPKMVTKGHDVSKDRVAVVLDHKERKIQNAFKMLREISGQNRRRRTLRRRNELRDSLQRRKSSRK